MDNNTINQLNHTIYKTTGVEMGDDWSGNGGHSYMTGVEMMVIFINYFFIIYFLDYSYATLSCTGLYRNRGEI